MSFFQLQVRESETKSEALVSLEFLFLIKFWFFSTETNFSIRILLWRKSKFRRKFRAFRFEKKNFDTKRKQIRRKRTKFVGEIFVSKKKCSQNFFYFEETRLNRTRTVLARAGLSEILPEEKNETNGERTINRKKVKSTSFWNLSNDSFYDANVDRDPSAKFENHLFKLISSIDFPVFRTIDELRNFHRPKLNFSRTKSICATNEAQPEHFSARSTRNQFDLSGRQGFLLLFEYNEENPVLINEIGMFSTIRTYSRPVEKRNEEKKRIFHKFSLRRSFSATFSGRSVFNRNRTRRNCLHSRLAVSLVDSSRPERSNHRK